jgi:hypothetical protein
VTNQVDASSSLPFLTEEIISMETSLDRNDRYIARFRRENEKASCNGIFKKAVDLVLMLRAANRGRSRYGHIKQVVEQYNSIGYNFVTRGSLCYRLSILSGNSSNNDNHIPESVEVHDINEQNTELSLLTDQLSPSANQQQDQAQDQQHNQLEHFKKCSGGRRRGSTNAAKNKHRKAISEATEKAAVLLLAECEKAKAVGKKVNNGTCTKIIQNIELASGLVPSTIKWKTVVPRADRKTPSGKAQQRKSPLEEVEPILVEYCT